MNLIVPFSTIIQIHPNLIGQVSALFLQKDQLISRSEVLSGRPCPYNRANLHQCINREIFYEEYVISWPHTLIFEITQRDSNNYNSSDKLDFPFQLIYKENDISIEYTLTGRVYSTSPSGVHFYSEVIRSFDGQSGVYKYDDLKNEGMALLESKDLTSLSGCRPQTTLVAYRINDFNNQSIYSNSRAS